MDELLICERPPTDRSPVTGKPVPPARLPQPRAFKSALAEKGLKKPDIDVETLLNTERRVRLWLDWVLRAQHGGGWDTVIDNVRWPSLLCGGYDRLCDPRGQMTFGKTYNTSHTALHLCFAYQAFGDPNYLEAARRTADMYLEIQQTTRSERFGDVGRWPLYAFFTPRPGAGPHELGRRGAAD